MDFVHKIKAILKKHPKAYINYYDSGAWQIYVDKKAFDKDSIGDSYLLDGWDTQKYGYADDLTVALGDMLGIKIDSY